MAGNPGYPWSRGQVRRRVVGFARVAAAGGLELLESAGELGEGLLDAHAFEGTGADETDGIGVLQDAIGVFGGVDGAAVGEEDDVLPDAAGGGDDLLRPLDGEIPGDDGVGDADGSTHRGADVGDDGVGAGFGHFDGFVGGGDVDDREEVHFSGEGDHFEFLLHAHAGFLEDAAEMAVDDRVGGEVVDAAEAHFLDLQEPVPHAAAGIGGVDAADYGDVFDHRKDLELADLHGDGVGVAVGHEAAGRSVAHHSEAAAVIDDDEVGAAPFDELGADAGAGSGGDDGVSFGERGAETFDHFLAGVGVALAGPGIGHGVVGVGVGVGAGGGNREREGGIGDRRGPGSRQSSVVSRQWSVVSGLWAMGDGGAGDVADARCDARELAGCQPGRRSPSRGGRISELRVPEPLAAGARPSRPLRAFPARDASATARPPPTMHPEVVGGSPPGGARRLRRFDVTANSARRSSGVPAPGRPESD
jgi:hypothetical protein